MNRLRVIIRTKRKINEKLDKEFMEKGLKNLNYQPLVFQVLEAEKTGLEKDLEYLDKQCIEDKKKAEGDDGGIERFEARRRKAVFDAKYRSFEVEISLRGINLKGGNYIHDMVVDSLKSMGFESPTLEGVENIKIDAVDSSFIASGKGASAQGDKPGISFRRIKIPLIKSPSLLYKTKSMKLEADSPVLEDVIASVRF